MTLLQIGILVFVAIELLNVMTLYFTPGMKHGNALGVFKAWDIAQETPQLKQLVQYLVDWVAGAKLIFILTGIVIVIWGNTETQIATAAAMVLSISSFFFRLFPAIKKMDHAGQIDPKGYSNTLLLMIVGFIIGFTFLFAFGLSTYLAG